MLRKCSILSLLAAILLAGSSACQKQAGHAKVPDQSGDLLERQYVDADKYLSVGDYPAAAEILEKTLESSGHSHRTPTALLRLAMIYSVPGSGAYRPDRASALLEQLIQEFPESPVRPEAELLANLLKDSNGKSRRIQELSKELETLRQIDLRKVRQP